MLARQSCADTEETNSGAGSVSAQVRLADVTDVTAVKALCRAYRQLLIERMPDVPEIVETYYAAETYEALLTRLPALHARPDGAIFVGEVDAAVRACGMTHRIDTRTCEIKRVYVAPDARGQGLAKGIFDAAMQLAKADGYRRMVLDTMTGLTEAIALYDALGFQPGPPFYTPDPRFADHILFFEAEL